jgi:hypothetical protein
MTGTQYFTSGRPLSEQEVMFRFLAREPRFRRRVLATSLHEVVKQTIESKSPFDARAVQPSNPGDPHYIFLFVKREPDLTDEEYRNIRVNLLAHYLPVTKLKFPEAKHIVGIASEAGLPPQRSEDLMYLDASHWTAEDNARAKKIQDEFGLLAKVTPSRGREYEYPIDARGKRRGMPSRNSPCPCGSHKRFKNCHGKEMFRPKRNRK